MNKWLNIVENEEGKTATIDINDTIGTDFWTGAGVNKKSISAELKKIGAIKGDTIYVNINSYGGDVNDGISIHDMLAQHPAKKVVRINGMTASAATVIAMAGQDIDMSENALFLAHRASTWAGGNVNEFERRKKELVQMDDLLANIYSKRTGKTKDEILAKMDVNDGQGEWLTAQEAKDFGFITSIFEPTAMVACADPEILKQFGLPEIPKNKFKQTTNKINMKSELRKKFDALFANVSEKLGFSAEVKEEKLKDGSTIKINVSGDKMAVGDTVTDEAGNPTPSKSYTLYDETVIKTDADSKISEIVSPQPVTATPSPATAVRESKEYLDAVEELERVKKENEELKKDFAHVEARMIALGKSIKSSGTPPVENSTQFRARNVETDQEKSLGDWRAKREKQIADKNAEAKKKTGL